MVPKADLIERLLLLPQVIATAEREVLEAERAVRRAEWALQAAEDEALLEGRIDGKNAETRAAQLRCHTAIPRYNVENAAAELAEKKITLGLLRNQMASLKSIARVMAAE
jgi:hypothetical protein